MENQELGHLVLKQITAHPESFLMDTWFSRPAGRHSELCGTAACLAGHAMLLSGYSFKDVEEVLLNGDVVTILACTRPDGTLVNGMFGKEAQMLLGMTDDERYGHLGEEDLFLDMFPGSALKRFTRLLLEG